VPICRGFSSATAGPEYQSCEKVAKSAGNPRTRAASDRVGRVFRRGPAARPDARQAWPPRWTSRRRARGPRSGCRRRGD
jgi:hypothetical protein